MGSSLHRDTDTSLGTSTYDLCKWFTSFQLTAFGAIPSVNRTFAIVIYGLSLFARVQCRRVGGQEGKVDFSGEGQNLAQELLGTDVHMTSASFLDFWTPFATLQPICVWGTPSISSDVICTRPLVVAVGGLQTGEVLELADPGPHSGVIGPDHPASCSSYE